ncbi:FUSC family protein [Kaistia geumhonensis]|uniref:Membrane protein YccC n=1 Tax=Kaistia geumhonensis TaxID=410839 RepID=A0ABU0M8S5_9HYPH|nr:FUSC family protein [Kaistia geumhonensis]MCX5477442.1 FUSC family protein [Kaistia geumhonensis]MDQ0517351.1 putative membrane protein YccC [Kaistia geumhonensis]
MSVTSPLGLAAGRDSRGPLQAILWLKGRFGPRLSFGLRLATSVCLTLSITYFLELPNSFWAATTAAIVCQPSFGASLQKGRFRIIGTLTGALVMVALLGLFAQQRDLLILGLALFCGFCGFAAVALQGFAAYAAALAGITATIIFTDTLSDPTDAFFLSLIRVSEIGIGIGAATFVMLVTDPGLAGRQLSGLLARIADQMAAGFVASMASEAETDAMRAARREIVHSLAPLNAAIGAAVSGSARCHARRGNLHAAREALVASLVSWRTIGHHPGRISGDDTAATRAALGRLLAPLGAGSVARDPAGIRAASRHVLAELRAMEGGAAIDALLRGAARDLATFLVLAADALLMLRGQSADPQPARRPRLVIDDPLFGLLAAFRAFAAVLAVSAFAIASGWSNGGFAIVFTAVATLIFVARDDLAPALAWDNALGTSLMAVVAGALYFGLLPALTTFPALLVVLFLLFAALGFMQAGTWHPIVFLAMSISALPMLGVGNPPSYDAAAYLNLCLAIIAGNLVGVLFFAALPVPGPTLRMRRFIGRSLRELRREMRRPTASRPSAWSRRLERRLEAIPAQASLADAGALLSLLAVGEAVIRLKRARLDPDRRRLASEGLSALAAADLQGARGHFEALAAMRDANDLTAEIAVIVDAIDGQPGLLASGAVPSAQT